MQFSTFHKLRLLALCVFVEGVYYALALMPAAALAWLGALFYTPEVALALGAVLFVVVLRALQPDPFDDRDAVPVAPGSVLHDWVLELSEAVGGGKIHRIVLTDELNASAHVSPGWLGLGARRTLSVGLPLLLCLGKDEIRAIVAHELGHFSLMHNRAGQWIYRVRFKWSIFLLTQRSDEDGLIESLQKLVARWFVPFLLRQSSAWSQQCEYEADGCTRQAGLARSLVDALVKIELHAHVRRHAMQPDWLQWKLDAPTPPADIVERTQRSVQDHAAQSFAPMLAATDARPASLYDTHPRLAERAQHLGVAVELPLWPAWCAGAEAFPGEWPSLLKKHQTAWVERQRNAWCFAHYRLRWLQAEAQAHPGDVVLQAVAAASLSPSADALLALQALAATHPDDAYLRYEIGAALLDADDEEGISHLQAAVRMNKKMAVPALRRISDHHLERDSTEAIERSLRKLDAAQRWSDAFVEKDLWSRFTRESLEPLPTPARRLLSDAVSSHQRIDGCWVGSLQSRPREGCQFRIYLMVFRMDGTGDASPHLAEGSMKADMVHLLATITRPDELVCVKAVFYTEPLSPRLLENLTRHPEICITPPRQPLNQDLVRIDAL